MNANREGETDVSGTGQGARPVILLTGFSGAGISTALKALEDVGFEAVDNLPLTMIGALIDDGAAEARPVAVAIDTRARGFGAAALVQLKNSLAARPGLAVSLLFIDCDVERLLQRFTETRRRHPLAIDRPVADGIGLEAEMLAPLRQAATEVLDTSKLTLHDLRHQLRQRFARGAKAGLLVNLLSFSFKQGLPREADLVFDVRFLANPHWVPALRPLTGRDAPVREAIIADPVYEVFTDRLKALLAPLLPRYATEGKSYLTIAIGCTGGRHRSVHMAEMLGAWVGALGYRLSLRHRELAEEEGDLADRPL